MSDVDGASPTRVFFVHVQKTGGTSFYFHLRRRFRKERMYPWPEIDGEDPTLYANINRLLTLPAERLAPVEVFSGHFPFAATRLLGIPLTTLSIVREPVSRVVSYLHQRSILPGPYEGWELERLYDDPFVFGAFVHNYQTKVFSMGPGDRFETTMDEVEMDEARLAIAKASLDEVDVLGVTERFGRFLDDVTAKLGWEFRDLKRVFAADEVLLGEAGGALLERIAVDNALDAALYRHALATLDAREGRDGR